MLKNVAGNLKPKTDELTKRSGRSMTDCIRMVNIPFMTLSSGALWNHPWLIGILY